MHLVSSNECTKGSIGYSRIRCGDRLSQDGQGEYGDRGQAHQCVEDHGWSVPVSS